MHEHRSRGPRDEEPQAGPDALERRVALLLLFSVAVSSAFSITAILAAIGVALALTNLRTPLYNRLPLWWPFWVGVAPLAVALGYLDRAVRRRLCRARDELQRRRACVHRAWPLIARGLELGFQASLVGSLAFSILPLSFVLRPHWLASGLYVVGLGWLFFRCAAAPGALGGALIALNLYAVAPRTQRLPAVGILIGFLVGGLAVIPAMLIFPGELLWWERDWVFRLGAAGIDWVLYLAAVGIATASGGWVGRKLAGYEVQRRACLRDE